MGTDHRTVVTDLQKGLAPVYLVEGAERLLVDEAVTTILKAGRGQDAGIVVQRLDLTESACDARKVLAECQSMGLFASRNLVVLRAAELLDKKTTIRDALADYAKNPNPSAVLILVAQKLNRSSRLYKQIKKVGKVYSFEPLKIRQAPSWVQGEARRLGHGMEISTARFVVELAGTSLLQLRLVVDQLSLFVGPGKEISAPTVETVLAATRPHSIFELVDAVADQRPEKALRHLSAMLSHREPPLRILAMIVRHFRYLWQVQFARGRGASLEEVVRELKLHPYQAKKLYGQALRFTDPFFRETYERLFETDAALKSSGLDHQMVLEQLIMGLCRVHRGAAHR